MGHLRDLKTSLPNEYEGWVQKLRQQLVERTPDINFGSEWSDENIQTLLAELGEEVMGTDQKAQHLAEVLYSRIMVPGGEQRVGSAEEGNRRIELEIAEAGETWAAGVTVEAVRAEIFALRSLIRDLGNGVLVAVRERLSKRFGMKFPD